MTKLHFDHLDTLLDGYKKAHEKFPDTRRRLFSWCECDELNDTGGKPYVYEVLDDDYALYTLGADGAVGGKELDYDFSRHTRWDEHLK